VLFSSLRQAGGVLYVGGRVQQTEGNLTIQGVIKSDHGIYECEARNEVRTIITSTDVIVQSMFIWATYHYTTIYA